MRAFLDAVENGVVTELTTTLEDLPVHFDEGLESETVIHEEELSSQDLDALLEEDSTFYGDLFAHVVHWQGDLYLEDGLHRALRAALQQRQTMHARILELK